MQPRIIAGPPALPLCWTRPTQTVRIPAIEFAIRCCPSWSRSTRKPSGRWGNIAAGPRAGCNIFAVRGNTCCKRPAAATAGAQRSCWRQTRCSGPRHCAAWWKKKPRCVRRICPSWRLCSKAAAGRLSWLAVCGSSGVPAFCAGHRAPKSSRIRPDSPGRGNTACPAAIGCGWSWPRAKNVNKSKNLPRAGKRA